MQRYLEVFFRRPLAFLAPVVVCVIASVVIVALQTRTYQASTRVWFESSALAITKDQTPAAVAVNTFQEILGTRTFCVKVGHNGSLADYLDQPGHMPGTNPLSAVLALVEAGRGAPPLTHEQLLNDAVQEVLQKKVNVTATGPQIVTVTFDFRDAQVAAATVQALLDQFSEDVLDVRLAQSQSQETLLSKQMADQQKRVQDADAAASSYLAAHPELRVSLPPPDAMFAGLQQEANLAHGRYASLLQELDKAKLDAAGLQQRDNAGFRIVDAPELPHRPVSRLKSMVLSFAGSLAAGALISLCALVVLVLGDNSIRNQVEVEQSLGLRVAGTIPFEPAPLQYRTLREKRTGSALDSGAA